jgi:O-antigen/teichoic acid export membrane protein
MPSSILFGFMRGIFSTGCGRIMNLGLGMLSLFLVVRHISAEAYGVFVLIRVITMFLAEISNFGLTLVIPKYLASSEDFQHKHRLINTIVYFRVLTILLSVPLILAARPALVALFGSSPLLMNVYGYIPVLFVLDSLARTFTSIMQGLFRFRLIGIVNTVAAIVNFIATLVLVLYLNLSTVGLVYALLISNALIVITASGAAHIKFRHGISLDILKEMLIFGSPLQMQFMLNFVFSRIDTVLIGSFLGTAGVAFYEVARKLPDGFMSLYEAFQSVYYPFISRFHAEGEREKLVRLLNNSIRVLLFLTSFLALLAVLFGKEIISLLFSPEYLPSYYAFVVLMFGLSLSVLDNTLGYSLLAIGEANKPLVVNLVRTIISFLLNLVVTPIFSFTGASVVAVVSNLIAAPLDAYFLWKRKVHAEIWAFFKPIVIAGGYGLLFHLLGSSLFSLKVVFSVLFVLTCLWMAVITREDWRLILTEARTARNNHFLRKEALAS